MMSQPPTGNHVADLTWRGVEMRLAGGAAALLPIGAAAKEHGLHMPMNTDELQADWLAAQAAERHDLLIWPTLRYGAYPAFLDFPGSISLSTATFEAVIGEILTGIAVWRPRAIFVLNTGISTVAPVEAAVRRLELHTRPHHLRIYSGEKYRAAVARVCEQDHGSHADEAETSRMLAIAPDKVDMNLAGSATDGPILGALTRQNAPSGSYGAPRLASTQKGEVLLAAMLEDLHQSIATALAAQG
jgi:creatinine amidohydrolase